MYFDVIKLWAIVIKANSNYYVLFDTYYLFIYLFINNVFILFTYELFIGLIILL